MRLGGWGIAVALAGAACSGGGDGIELLPAGGATTIDDRSSLAYRQPAPNLDADGLELHLAGDAAFEASFVTAPAPVNGGLGPLFNHVSCGSCHINDGRGHSALSIERGSPALVRLSLPEGSPDVPGGAAPVPGMGTQLQDHAVFGHTPEAAVTLAWIEETATYADGVPYNLRRPALDFAPALPDGTMTSMRQAPPVFGLGLLEAVDESTLRELEDPGDRDGDGISGRVNLVWDVAAGEPRVGRFGHKANNPTLRQQGAGAYANDMGVSNRVFPDDGGAIDVGDDTLDATIFYTQTLAVPARLEGIPDADRGAEHFAAFGCASCHVATLTTGEHPIAALAGQTIQPFTDLLLHDLGEGLADGRPDFMASGSEWRTAPLWGLGLVQTVLAGGGYLHDGRARTLEEAILWHGGEAEAAREAFRTATAGDRAALIAFLISL